jgi:Tfp pilus assembly protein PilX
MAVNPLQADHSTTATSEDNPEVKLQNLEREVDLIKTSIKRLLMDIRERMNELDNPFTLNAAGENGGISAETEAKLAALETKEAALVAREAEFMAAKTQAAENQKVEQDSRPAPKNVPAQTTPQYAPQPVAAVVDERRLVDEHLLAQFKAQLMGTKSAGERTRAPPLSEKSRLQKVYKLFKWTNQSVRKYGNDRFEIMLQTYKTMGYISKESSDEIREIARLMPASLGDEHEVGPDEFVAELYTLNRIIAPDDTTLDRDMIELMMEQRSQPVPAITLSAPPSRIEFPGAPVKEKKPAKERDYEEDWMNLPDRI